VGNVGISCVLPPLKSWAADTLEKDIKQFVANCNLEVLLILTGPFVDETTETMKTELLVVAQNTPVLSKILNDAEKLDFLHYLDPIEDGHEYFIEFLICNGTFFPPKIVTVT